MTSFQVRADPKFQFLNKKYVIVQPVKHIYNNLQMIYNSFSCEF